MRICITGANGAVGRALVHAVRQDATLEVVAVVRSRQAASRVPSLPESRGRVVVVDYGDSAGLQGVLDGSRVVIHLPGILFESRGASYEQANRETTRAVATAAARSGVGSFLLVSALGADPAARNRYFRSKGEAEELVRKAGLAGAILRVPILLGRDAPAAHTLRRQLSTRRIWLLDGGRTWHQPLDVDDLARALLSAARSASRSCRRVALAGPERLRHREWVGRAASLVGRSVPVGTVPVGLARAWVALRARLGPGGLSPDALEVLLQDEPEIEARPAARELGVELSPLEATLRRSLGLPVAT